MHTDVDMVMTNSWLMHTYVHVDMPMMKRPAKLVTIGVTSQTVWHKEHLQIQQHRQMQVLSSVYSQEQLTYPTAGAPPGPAAAGQRSAWLAYQQGPVERQRRLQEGPGCSLGPFWTGQKGAGGVRRPGTCAGSGQACPELGSEAAKEARRC